MHSLKFRVWNKTLHKYGHFALKKGVSVSIVADLEIEQYTGLKDKNGKEIYEGDIVDVSSVFISPTTVVVKFSEFSCGYEPFVNGCVDCYVPCGKDVKVIGNIHENPELLRKEK